MIELVIPGRPMGKHRPRFVRKGGHVSTYSHKKDVNYETLIALSFRNDYPDHEPFLGPISMFITAYMPIPKATSQKRRAEMVKENEVPTTKPDADNIAKIVCDALNGVAYKDDNQIAVLSIKKYYSDVPRLEIRIEEV